MKRIMLITVILTVGLLLYLSGCSDKSDQIVNPSFSGDKEYFSSVLNNDAFFTTEDPNLEDGDALPADYGSSFAKVEGGIYPFRFGKKIESVRRSVTYDQLNDSVVIATVTKTITGKFIIAGSYNSSSTRPDTVIRKPFTETTTRKVRFVRVAPPGSPPWKGWKLDAISLIKGGTENNEVTINQIVVRPPSDDSLVVTSPNDYFLSVEKHSHHIPEMDFDEPLTIRLTLVSTRTDTEVVVLRYGADHDGFNRLRNRFHLVSQTQNGASYSRTYELTIRAHKHDGKFNAVAEAITHDSIYDDSAPLKNNYWGIPYVVR